MIFSELNASDFKYTSTFYNAEFESILSKIIECYCLMIKHKVRLYNDENSIRDILLINYLKNNQIRKELELTNYLFDREVPEDYANGRTDIKIQTLNTFLDTKAYYTIECKKLNASNPTGRTGLNAKYIRNGICRFVSSKYSSYFNTSGMIGFVVESLDINKNIISLNSLIKSPSFKSNTSQELGSHVIVEGFDYSYCSKHKVKTKEIIIYHLMFDFSVNIQ